MLRIKYIFLCLMISLSLTAGNVEKPAPMKPAEKVESGPQAPAQAPVSSEKGKSSSAPPPKAQPPAAKAVSKPALAPKKVLPAAKTQNKPQPQAPAGKKVPAGQKSAPAQVQAPAASIDVGKLIDSIQKRYDSTGSAIFDFAQSYKHPFLAITESSKGKVYYQKTGGKLVWSYLEPAAKQKKFFIEGKKFTFYSIADKNAFTHNCYSRDTLSASIAFLMGSGNLKDSFTFSLLTGHSYSPALTWITLVPKEKDGPVTKIVLGVDKDFQVKESVVDDPSGGKNHFQFQNFEINKKIPPSTFVFTPPKGVLVQPMPNVSCPEANKPSQNAKPAASPKK